MSCNGPILAIDDYVRIMLLSIIVYSSWIQYLLKTKCIPSLIKSELY